MNVSIIIPNYNGRELLEKNLNFIVKAFKNKNNKILEIIVVDDCSTDESISYLTKNFKDDVKLIKHTKNRGFSSSVNTGVRSSKGDIVCLLNTDVSPNEDFLKNVDNIFKDNLVFAVSLNEGNYGASRCTFENGYIKLGMKSKSNKLELCFYVSGGSGLFRKSIWQDLGGMDEKLLSPLYWEDIDLSYRASKRGYINYWSYENKVNHIHESTVSKLSKKYIAKIRERNQLIMLWKNIQSRQMMTKHIQFLFRRAVLHPGYFIIIFSALIKLPLILKARKKELKECKVSDEAVFQKYS